MLELLVWSDCPSHEEAHARLHALLAELGRPDQPVETRWIETDEAAHEHGFVGSPTFRWAGRDLVPPPEGTPYGLTCRLYWRRDGRPSPLPDPDDLRDALTAVLGQTSLRASNS